MLLSEFEDNQRALALHAGIDPAQLFRVLTGDSEPTPQLVGRLCGTLPAVVAARLIAAFLQDIVDATTEARPNKKPAGPWRQPLSDVSVGIHCAPRRKTA